jgi:integrase
MSLVEAREAWRVARLAVAKGENPAHVRPTAADSFAAVAADWLDRDQGQNRSAKEVRRVIMRDVVPMWGDRPIARITRRDVAELIDRIVDRGAVIMARRLHSHLHRLFRWAVGRGILETNPMADLPKPGAAVKRDRVLTDSELAAVWKATEKVGWPFGPAVRLLILTSSRRDEIGSLAWSEIHGDEIRLSAERSKSGEARIVPLSPAAVALIDALPRTSGEFVFSHNGSGLGGWSRAKRAIDAAAADMNGGPLPPWRLHDVRRSAATRLQGLGVGLQVVESILGHVAGSRGGIVSVYQKYQYLTEQRAALTAWAQELDRIVQGKRTPTVHFASAVFAGSGSMSAGAIDPQWRKAVMQADRTGSLDPMIAFLKLPGAQLGPGECLWLRLLLERMQFNRKSRGRHGPVGEPLRGQQLAFVAEHVRELRRTNNLTRDEAIDSVIPLYPDLLKHDEGASLANFMKRGDSPKKIPRKKSSQSQSRGADKAH